jgi:hypothetical protein
VTATKLESWEKKNSAAPYTYEKAFNEDTCPVCGKKFLRMCRRNEWGYWYGSGDDGLTLLCSAECSKKYAHDKFMASVRRVMRTKAFAVYKIIMQENIPAKEAAKRVGLTSWDSTLTQLKVNRWKELEWIEKHGWEAGE